MNTTTGAGAPHGLLYAAVAMAVICAVACAFIASAKGRNVGGHLLLGLCLGVIGLIITACVPARRTAVTVPAGWYPDPWRLATWRWYDGLIWTHHTG